MRRRHGGRPNNKLIPVCVAFGAAVICLTFFSVEILLTIIALAFVALGVWLLFCC